jgi:hypothetical protein
VSVSIDFPSPRSAVTNHAVSWEACMHTWPWASWSLPPCFWSSDYPWSNGPAGHSAAFIELPLVSGSVLDPAFFEKDSLSLLTFGEEGPHIGVHNTKSGRE